MNFVITPFFSVCLITTATIAGLLFRPLRLPEAIWACLGVLGLFLLHLISWEKILGAVSKGTDVYFFLAGMMLLSELARREGVFDWLAYLAVSAAKGSAARLFLVLYGVGILVTTFLSNDATAVVLTPAVFAAVKKAKVDPLPYLLACAFIANAASFVLPISNPANLVFFDGQLPPLLSWMRIFLIPAALSITTTFFVLRFATRKQLRGTSAEAVDHVQLSEAGRLAAWSLVAVTITLLASSISGVPLGFPTFLAAIGALLIVSLKDGQALVVVMRRVSWSVIPLVAGLFVIVEALNEVGILRIGQMALQTVVHFPFPGGDFGSAFGIALISNLMNNLPVGLIAANILHTAQIPASIRYACLIGVDLGPNLSVTGSLATILWLTALRKEGFEVTAWTFFRFGLPVMPIALIAAVAALLLTSPLS